MHEASEITPARWSQTFSAAWLMSRAFTTSRDRAMVTYPLCLLDVVAGISGRHLYVSSDGDGMALLHRHDRRAVAVRASVGFAVGVLILGATLLLFGELGPMLFSLALGAVSSTHILRRRRLSEARSAGPETPSGERWELRAVGQRPGTRLSALLLARRLIRSLPSGAVVVSVSPSSIRTNRLRRLGFTRGYPNRIFLRVDGPVADA